MKNKRTIQIKNKNGEVIFSRDIYELNRDEVYKYKLIGTGAGISVEHAFYLGARRSPDFLERAYAFRVEGGGLGAMINEAMKKAGLEQQSSITVSFYAPKGYAGACPPSPPATDG